MKNIRTYEQYEYGFKDIIVIKNAADILGEIEKNKDFGFTPEEARVIISAMRKFAKQLNVEYKESPPKYKTSDRT